ncbi:hypothetical protein RJ639_047428 [Escallonia herrerae]|uniref:BHLH domain-containing protein n=1 Tax=Escallonia herrerae TaxID=1293975 RepID=A0AA88W8Y6_9ASTE|nr:hypothetical protein RJ639_047428 [Escallonia herrerae]
MNRALPEMLHCLNMPGNVASGGGTADISVLERQRARMKWQQDQHFLIGNHELNVFSAQQLHQLQGSVSNDPGFAEYVTRALKPDPGMESGWPDVGKFGGDDHLGYGACGYGNVSGIEMNYEAIARTVSCPPTVAAAISEAAVTETKGKESILPEKLNSAAGRESFKKRKADKNHNLKVVAEEDVKDKRIKGCAEEGDSKITEQNSSSKANISNNNNRETSTDTSTKENSKVTEVQKPDYIHVRARRGQATDSHSLAERVRREKISERMKYLQDLVPGCNKITGKAGMLDEIINYVQSLQRQVEFLSMKLAAVNPRLDFNIENIFTKEIFPACASTYPTIEVSSEMANPAYFQLSPLQQVVSCCGLEMGINPPDMALKRTTSAPVSIPETFLDSSCFNQIQATSTWDSELQNLYSMEFQQGRSTTFPSQTFTGSIEGGNLKMEM